MAKTCTIDCCERPIEGRGMCQFHRRRSAQGLPLDVPPRPIGQTLEERFWSKVDKSGPDGHWIWTGEITKSGYGRISHATAYISTLTAHRAAMMIAGFDIDGVDVHHECFVPLCVNPEHLSLQEPYRNRVELRRTSTLVSCPECSHEFPLFGARRIRPIV